MSNQSTGLLSSNDTEIITYPLPFCWPTSSDSAESSPEEIRLELRVAVERASRIEKFISEAKHDYQKTYDERVYGLARYSPEEAFWTCLIGALFLEPETEFEGLGMARIDKVDLTTGQHNIVVRYKHKDDKKGPFKVIFRVIHICSRRENVKDHMQSSIQAFSKWAMTQDSFDSCFILISCKDRVVLARVWKCTSGMKITYGGQSGQEVVLTSSKSFVFQICGMMQWLEKNNVYPTKFTKRKHCESRKEDKKQALLFSAVNEPILLAGSAGMSVRVERHRAIMSLRRRAQEKKDRQESLEQKSESPNKEGESPNEQDGSCSQEEI
ncbi:hypothetical protein BZA77DRAFT_291035 [Pyronema omphalodes]|nr:hypothetical protein BZA77DRAFT_291035 [Pyronema omphalodes]